MTRNGEEPNPYEAPRSTEAPIRDLVNTLGPHGTFVVALVSLASGAIACGTSCTAIVFVGVCAGAVVDKGYTGAMIGFATGILVGLYLLVFVTRRVTRRLTKKFNR